MPSLPAIGDYEQHVDLSEPYRKITPNLTPGNVGATLENVGNQWANAVDLKNRSDGAVYAANQMADMRTRTAKLLDDAKQNAQPDASGFTQTVLDQYDKDSATLLDKAKGNPYSTFALQQHLTQFRSQVADHAINWEAQTGVQFRGNSVLQNIDKLAPVVEADPAQWKSAGAEQMNAINNSNLPPEQRILLGRKLDETLSVAAANGLARQDPRGVIEGLNDPSKAHPAIAKLSDQQRESLRLKANDNLGKPVYDSLTDGDVGGAQVALNSVKDIIDPKNAFVLQRTIDAQIKEKQNDQKQDIADRFQDSMTAAEHGLPGARIVTRGELEVLYPKDAQRHWDALQGMIAAGSMAQDMDKMTPEEAAAHRDAAYPTSGGPETASKLRAYDVMNVAFQRSMANRNADPAQFAINNSTGWKPLDISKPDDMLQQLRSRANTQGAVSEQTGVNTPLLSKAENRQFTSWIASQPPADRVATLTTLRAAMPNDQSYAALMKQIAPGSSLTAVAGSMMDRPAQGAVPNWFNPTFATSQTVPMRILEGEAILTGKPDEKGEKGVSKFPMPKDTDLMPQFMAAVGGANSDLFRGRPETQENTYAAFKAYYAAEASRQGVTNGVINTSIAAKAATSVIGNATQYGPTNLVVPNGMDPTKFEGTVDAATKTALRGGGYSDADIEALHGGGLRELGDTLGTGRYVIVNGNGDPLKTKDGKRSVIIDLNQSARIPNALPAGEPLSPGRATTIGDRR